ncbi:MAG: tetratricopeptide repeat protein [Leptolyngbyaceae cyanobacterium bins.59]|nr:tetratricopeptide repeat protein [Leptolyngbyaceae cyanobacterium bins.59]
MNTAEARQQFKAAIDRPDCDINLAEAALCIALEEYPFLPVTDYLQQIDRMAEVVRVQLPAEKYPLRIIQTINRYLYQEQKFVGNTESYYDPRNSFLNDVLDRKTGIPITLALVYLEIARRIDFPMVGINMPGHFVIKPEIEDMDVYVDAFHEGQILFPEDCRDRLTAIYGQTLEISQIPSLLEKISSRRFLARMLTNLKYIYLNQGVFTKALAVVERLLLLFPDNLTEVRDRGILYYQLGQSPEAIRDLETYLLQLPQAEDALPLQQLLDRLKNTL